MDKWEYTKYIFNGTDCGFIEFLNIHGKHGWEYIESETLTNGVIICIFKRKIQQENGNKA